ncbi:MAG TPA: MlaD family protein [Candidatus Acidoferrales bacterium]|nr:MlaD family protein [Candidatus Acidoferrales bacterium]
MESKKEQAVVGLFVIIVVILLVVTIFMMSGRISSGDVTYHAYFKNAGGLEPGSQVRYAGGPSVGHVDKVRPDPRDPSRMEIEFAVRPETPVKTDSTARITSATPLGDNYLEIRSENAAGLKAPAGATLKSLEYSSFADIASMISDLGPNANELIANLKDRTEQLEVTLDRVNDLLDDKNRANISGTLANLNGMLEEDRSNIKGTLTHLNDSSAKFGPLVDDFRKTAAQAQDTLSHLDAAISEDRPDLKKSIAEMQRVLASAQDLTEQLNHTLNGNSENLDEIFDSLRRATENLNEFTDTIKTRPYTLLRSTGGKPRNPGDPPSK